MIEIEHLSKQYGEVDALSDLSLTVDNGEFFGFLGPNGAGKTTTIKILTGLTIPTSGNAKIGGYDIEKDPEKAKSLIAYIPDRPFIYEKLSGKEFLEFIGDVFSVSQSKMNDKIDELIDLFNLNPWKDELIESYSHGMKQKLLFASAFLHDPEVLIIDEPMVGLDPKSIILIKELLQEKCESGMTVFMSTHSLELVEDVCTRLGIIHSGKLIATGTIEELRKMAETDKKGLVDIFLRLTEEESMKKRELNR